MKLSVAIADEHASANAFVVFRGIDASVKKAHALGYDGVELALKDPTEIDRSHLKKLLQENGMAVSAVSTGQVWAARSLCFTEEDEGKRDEVRKAFHSFIDIASDFGQLVNIGRTRGGINGRDPKLCGRLFVDMAQELSDYAAPRGVRLILEPVNRYEIDFVNNLDECAEQVKLVGRSNFSMMPDVFHMNIEDAHIGEALFRNRAIISYIHFADTNRHAPGDGHMDWDEIFGALQAIGYKGWTTVEILPYQDPDTAAKRAVDFLKGVYGRYYGDC
jgi:sugar phosphate isomerase/epimerase